MLLDFNHTPRGLNFPTSGLLQSLVNFCVFPHEEVEMMVNNSVDYPMLTSYPFTNAAWVAGQSADLQSAWTSNGHPEPQHNSRV